MTPAPTIQRAPSSIRFNLLALLFILIATGPFWLAVPFPFIQLDDGAYISGNPHVLTGLTPANISWAFSNTEVNFWIPATWLSLQLDASLFGTHSWGFHLTNVVLHGAASFVLFLLLQKITARPWASVLVAVLFAVHPLRVESVAWATERKDVLALFLGMLSTSAYVAFLARPRASVMILSLCLFLASLMAKPLLVTLPLIFLLLDAWPLGRFGRVSLRRLIVEKLPFAGMSLGISLSVVLYHSHIHQGTYEAPRQLGERLANAAVSAVMYLRDTVYFERLALLYPWKSPTPITLWLPSLALLLAITVLVIAAGWRSARARPLLVGWLWILVALLPVAGIVQSGDQSRADRFTYFPSIGIFIAIVFSIPVGWTAMARQWRVAFTLAVLVVTFLAAATTRQLLLWRDPLTLYRATIERTSDNWFIMSLAAEEYQKQGQYAEAIDLCRRVVRLAPFMSEPENNLGGMLAKTGRLEEALPHLQRAHELDLKNDVYRKNYEGLKRYLASRPPATTRNAAAPN